MINRNHKKWIDMVSTPNEEIAANMGKYLKMHRLRWNKTQQELADDSGIKRETITRMERGANFTIGTFIQVLRHLNALDSIIDFFRPIDAISPSLYVKMAKRRPVRVKHSKIELIKNDTIKKTTSK